MNASFLRVSAFLLAAMFSCAGAYGTDPSVDLRFNTDSGTFKIAQFTDLHWAKSAASPQTLQIMANVLDAENPDLVILTGDIVWANAGATAWQTIVKVMQDRQIPWTVALGNHDTESGLSRAQIISLLEPLPYSLVEPGPTTIGGLGNEVLGVKASDSEQDAAALYCLDTQYSGMSASQIQWYRDQSAALTLANGGTPLPSLAFFHIPLPEYNYFGTDLVNGQIGQKHEQVCYEGHTGAMFAAIEDAGDVMGVFVGHDHVNDYALYFDNTCLAYGRATGVGGYGDLERGGRIIELTEGQPGFDSWIRTTSGLVVDPFHFQPVPEPSSLLMLTVLLTLGAGMLRGRSR